MPTKQMLLEELEHKKELIRAHIAYRLKLESELEDLESENRELRRKLLTVKQTLEDVIYKYC